MSTVDVVEIGRKWFAVTVNFDESERARIREDALRMVGAKLRFPASGGLRAKFHLNLHDENDHSQMVRLLQVFGEGGAFESSAGRFTTFSQRDQEPDESMTMIEERLAGMCSQWSENWQNEAVICLRERVGRVQTLRRVQSVAGEAVDEATIRVFLEKELRRRYKSDIFGATVLWRLGWPDTRPAQKQAHQNVETTESRPVYAIS